MHKNSLPSFSTGKFAALLGTNKRTLFHYDEIGLFSPAYIDEKGYRFYSERQCETFELIAFLKDLGMPLKQIKQFVLDRCPEDLERLFVEQSQFVSQEIKRLKRIELMIQTKLTLFEEAKTLSDSAFNQVVVEDCPTEHLILSQRLASNDHDSVIRTIYQHISYCHSNGYSEGHPYGAMISCESMSREIYDDYVYFFTKIHEPTNDPQYAPKPAGSYAVTYIKGDYYDCDEAYGNLMCFVKENNYQLLGCSYKEGIIDEVAARNTDEYITKISVRIQSNQA